MIVREGEPTNKLLVIASGSADIVFESIVERKKLNIDPLMKKRKELRKKWGIEELRRKNLVDYEPLEDNVRYIVYYRREKVESRIRGDAVNWKGFCKSI